MGKVLRSDPQSLIKLPKPGPFHSQSLIIGSWELRNKMTRGVSLFPAAKLLTLIHTGELGKAAGGGEPGKGMCLCKGTLQDVCAAAQRLCVRVNRQGMAQMCSRMHCPMEQRTAVWRGV